MSLYDVERTKKSWKVGKLESCMKKPEPKKLLIANRGEIARRVARAGRARGYTVGVVSAPDDSDSPVRAEADAVLEVKSFLNASEIVQKAVAWGATHVHPGYGFLSENADFAGQVEEAGLIFVGPTPANMLALGGKESAKQVAIKCAVPTLNALLSHELESMPVKQWQKVLTDRGIVPPYLVKASGGGGGRGMRVVEDFEDLAAAIARASEEAKASFNDGTVFVERYLNSPRHIEVQVFGDGLGGGVFLGERECSLQRRHQKVIEEAPSSVVNTPLRKRMGEAAMALVRATHYRGAGTVEFLLDAKGDFFFLEMNTRLQVEHPVTEAVYQVDLVQAQLELSEGMWPESLGNPDVFSVPVPFGVALEARLLAEDPRNQFLPTPGPLLRYREPEGVGVRVDSGVVEKGRVNSSYYSMIAKIIVHGKTRHEAVLKMQSALENTIVQACTTNLPFLLAVSLHPDFLAGMESTSWIGTNLSELNEVLFPELLVELFESADFREKLSFAVSKNFPVMGSAARSFAALGNTELVIGSRRELEPLNVRVVDARQGIIEIQGERLNRAFISMSHFKPERMSPLLRAALFEWSSGRKNICVRATATQLDAFTIALTVFGETLQLSCPRNVRAFQKQNGAAATACEVKAPMAGRVLEVRAKQGEHVTENQVIFVVESMKMQLEVKVPRAGIVTLILVEPGQILAGPDTMAHIQFADALLAP